jgi:hypothetical protein
MITSLVSVLGGELVSHGMFDDDYAFFYHMTILLLDLHLMIMSDLDTHVSLLIYLHHGSDDGSLQYFNG